ncbi:uncharacterized protein LOC123701999 [Colias croceus]|uniref:uncharacterized protein LOC123701999 n=1 Tax=Colias crocea TaxID=72248 RepID=UPI001E27A429|nr:uncharacterized protein LOC123701999 [Colias croceus]
MKVRLVFAILVFLAFVGTPVIADYIWHRDEIPYEAKSKCLRGTSYYSNSLNANDTDIDVASEIESLLDYDNIDVCFFCVCSVDAKAASCINRDPWFCEYYRIIKEPDAMRHKYKQLFQQDRPAYFRQLSYRLRRTMDDSMFELIDKVGDKNDDSKCVPFVSEYSDCTDANMCTGCTKCHCTEAGEWSCKDVISCPDDDDGEDNSINGDSVYSAIDVLMSEVKKREQKQNTKQRLVPLPPGPEEDVLLVADKNRYEEDFDAYLAREKRSIDQNEPEHNGTVKFYNTIDEINEDTLKNSNKSGTIEVQKINPNVKISRRKGLMEGINKTELSSLHIEFNTPQDYEHQFAENKIDSFPHDEKSLALDKEKQNIIGNYSQKDKDKNLSKIVVNELTKGNEVIGDKNVIPVSNITFTPENDTLTAMAFIAGNLLNKLWNMDKESSDSFETETLKHEKINDLLELFKEPLNLRQETFLKNALEKLSHTLNNNKNVNNISICETIEVKNLQHEVNNTQDLVTQNKGKCNKTIKEPENIKTAKNVTSNVVQKLTDVLNLIQKFENTQKALNNLKGHTPIKIDLEEDVSPDTSKFDMFANVLEKITKLLLPTKKSNRIHRKMKQLNQLANDENMKNNIKGNGRTNLVNLTVTAKDKIVLDYVNHIQNNPQCLLNQIAQESINPSINLKGEIIDTLTEFLKIKSFIDLSKLIEPERFTTTTTSTTTQSTTTTKKLELLRQSDQQEPKKLASAKERLKLHLQSIINDLAELQKERGTKNNTNFNITDILPCISHILNDNQQEHSTTKKPSPLENMENLMEALTLEFKSIPLSRRSASSDAKRPTSAKVWRRVITNINHLQKQNRRFDFEEQKSYDDLKKMIDNIEKLSNTYKNFALLSVVPPHKKLMLLKTLEADVARHKNVLENIKKSYDAVENVPSENQKEIVEFIDNTATNIKLSNNVIANLNKANPKRQIKSINTSFTVNELSNKRQRKSNLKIPSDVTKSSNSNILKNVNKDFKLSREQILNQLISNRIQLYLKIKEEEGVESDDINYNIGKRALISLRRGNSSLARELFNILVQNKNIEGLNQTRRMNPHKKVGRKDLKGTFLYALKEPLLKIRDPRENIREKQQDLLFAK